MCCVGRGSLVRVRLVDSTESITRFHLQVVSQNVELVLHHDALTLFWSHALLVVDQRRTSNCQRLDALLHVPPGNQTGVQADEEESLEGSSYRICCDQPGDSADG